MTNSKDNKTKAPNVPPLRFPGFTDEWKTTKLKTYLVENKERNAKGKFSKEQVLSVSGDKGVVNQIELLGRSYAGQSVLPYHVVYHSDIVYTKSPLSDFPYGIVKMNRGVDGVVSTLYAVYSVLGTAHPSFIEYYFASKHRTNRFFKPIVRIGAKHDMKIGNSEVLANEVTFPDIDEQIRISKFLELIDERIATQNKIIDNLQSLIKGLAKVLTLQGEPNTRISDCLECHTSTLQESNLQESGKYPAYGASGIAGYLDAYTCDEYSILIIKDGSGVGTVSHVSGKYSVIGTMNNLTAKPGYSLNYLYFCLMNFNFEPFKTGMAIPHIYFKDYGRAKIWCPSLESQNDIAKILSAIEEKLQIESGILDSLHRKKSYLLNNMFI